MLSDFQDFEALVKVFLPLFDLRFGCLGSFGFLIFVDAHARHNQTILDTGEGQCQLPELSQLSLPDPTKQLHCSFEFRVKGGMIPT